MKVLIIFLVLFIALPLFFINKHFVDTRDTHWLAIAALNSLFLLAAYIAIDCHSHEQRKKFWGGIFMSLLGAAAIWLSVYSLQLGHVPTPSTGKGMLAYMLLNSLQSITGIYGVFLLINIFAGFLFYAGFKLIKQRT